MSIASLFAAFSERIIPKSISNPDKNIKYVKPNNERKASQGIESTELIKFKPDFPIIIPKVISPTTEGTSNLVDLDIHAVNIGIKKARIDTNNKGNKIVSDP